MTKTTDYIPAKHLFILNELMSIPNEDNTPLTQKENYPQLHLNYHLAIAGKLCKMTYQYYKTKHYFPIARLTPTIFGINIVNILLKHRPYSKWNLPYCHQSGLPQSNKRAKDYVSVKFIEPFLKKPEIIESHGKSPEQYPYDEW